MLACWLIRCSYKNCICPYYCSYLIIVVEFCISDSDSWCRSYTQSLWHERCDPFTNTVCSSISLFYLLTSIRGMFFVQNCFLLKMGLESLFRLPTIYLAQAFCMAATVCLSLFIWSILLVSGYCRWWLRMSCGCNLAIWQPHVHISMPMCLAKFTIYSQNQEPKPKKYS